MHIHQIEIGNFRKLLSVRVDLARDKAIDLFLEVPFRQIRPYVEYITHQATFDTHQGVKGLEFPRVLVIMDDTEARGFLFKYEKLFSGGAGDDNTTAATRRLFYVTCSRAEQSLCLVSGSTSARVASMNAACRMGIGWSGSTISFTPVPVAALMIRSPELVHPGSGTCRSDYGFGAAHQALPLGIAVLSEGVLRRRGGHEDLAVQQGGRRPGAEAHPEGGGEVSPLRSKGA